MALLLISPSTCVPQTTVALVSFVVRSRALQICGSGTSTHACVLFFPIPYAIYVSPFWRGILVVNYDDVDK